MVSNAPDSDLPIPLEDDSGTIALTDHRTSIGALTAVLNDSTAIGDLDLARLAAKLLVYVLGANDAEGNR